MKIIQIIQTFFHLLAEYQKVKFAHKTNYEKYKLAAHKEYVSSNKRILKLEMEVTELKRKISSLDRDINGYTGKHPIEKYITL